MYHHDFLEQTDDPEPRTPTHLMQQPLFKPTRLILRCILVLVTQILRTTKRYKRTTDSVLLQTVGTCFFKITNFLTT